ncbi:MAG: fumarylacetoacetate hydrolase family protein [Pseudoclavibacter sp.]
MNNVKANVDSTQRPAEGYQRPAALAQTPSKVIAVHLSYRSRAAQRGRAPRHPSYFFKPTSSLADTNQTVERPQGTELLAFEGEIALIIGRPARYVAVEDAWDHVAAVTASNDFGVYDLRSADKGSNVRSKGRDGYTPIGPKTIAAAQVRPDGLRVRVWVNGALVQEDTTADLLFPFAQIVADLSQHMTLETGDVILTGTPAGSSVVIPGDVVEVEVDAVGAGDEAAAGSLTTGRLSTTVVQGERPFDPSLGALPEATDGQKIDAWGSREEAGLSAAADDGVLSAELRQKLMELPVATLSQELRKRGLNGIFVDGVSAIRPDMRIVGTARTLRFVPLREDLFAAHGGGFNAQKQVFDSIGPGEVIVIEARGDQTSGTLGDVLAQRALVRQAAGVLTDGGVRDHDIVASLGLPVFAAGAHPAVLGRRHVPWEADVTVAVGGAAVQPGDVIVGDGDGVIVIPPALVEAVADAAAEQEEQDAWVAARVAEGHPIDGLFPPNAEWKQRYQTWRAEQSEQ